MYRHQCDTQLSALVSRDHWQFWIAPALSHRIGVESMYEVPSSTKNQGCQNSSLLRLPCNERSANKNMLANNRVKISRITVASK
jgi:hypothetical protein